MYLSPEHGLEPFPTYIKEKISNGGTFLTFPLNSLLLSSLIYGYSMHTEGTAAQGVGTSPQEVPACAAALTFPWSDVSNIPGLDASFKKRGL